MENEKMLFYQLLFIGFVLVAASSCKKDDVEIPSNTFTDTRDGNVYKTVTIGNQVWMAENLRFLPSVASPATGSETDSYYYVYGYDGTNVNDAKATANYDTFGVLYNWEAAKVACPAGWHLPSNAESRELAGFVEFNGGKLKESGTTNWKSPNAGATNETGFTALPGGVRINEDINLVATFLDLGLRGVWWSATASNSASNRGLTYDYDMIFDNDRSLADLGFSVRCVKD